LQWPLPAGPASWLDDVGLGAVAAKLRAGPAKDAEESWTRALKSLLESLEVKATGENLILVTYTGPDAENGHRFRANGSVLVEPGFIAVYQEGRDDAAVEEGDRLLPEVNEGDVISLDKLRPEQHFTEPPPRFTEASLVKTLEEYGIGRPSTYASIIATLKNREYVEMDGKRFIPTDIGRIVNGFLTEHFTQYVDYDFTAKLEDDLDAISLGEKDLVPLLDEFWKPFSELVLDKEQSVSREQVAQARDLGVDPKSGKPMTVRMGRYGPFVQIGTKDDEEKPKFAGLRPGQKMNDITQEEALELFKLPRTLGETPDGLPVMASVGRFGPYIAHNIKPKPDFRSLKKDDVYTITLERALEILKEEKKTRGFKKKAA